MDRVPRRVGLDPERRLELGPTGGRLVDNLDYLGDRPAAEPPVPVVDGTRQPFEGRHLTRRPEPHELAVVVDDPGADPYDARLMRPSRWVP